MRLWPLSALLLVLLAGCGIRGEDSLVARLNGGPAESGSETFIVDMADLIARHSPHTGVHAFESPGEALVARVRLIDGVRQTLDVRHPGWRDDEAGRFLLSRLGHAAQRGVRVRLLLDAEDARDALPRLASYAAQPGFEIRLLGAGTGSPPHLRHRLLIAGNQIALIERAGIEMPLRPIALSDEVLVIGPLMPVITRCFYLDWSSPAARDVPRLAAGETAQRPSQTPSDAYAAALRDSRIARLKHIDELRFVWDVVQLSNGAKVGAGCH